MKMSRTCPKQILSAVSIICFSRDVDNMFMTLGLGDNLREANFEIMVEAPLGKFGLCIDIIDISRPHVIRCINLINDLGKLSPACMQRRVCIGKRGHVPVHAAPRDR